MAEVINMSIRSFVDFDSSALDLRKRNGDSPECQKSPKKFKYYSKDGDRDERRKLLSPVNSHGSSTPSPTSCFDSSFETLNSLHTRRNDQKFKVHAPIQWPLEAARGFSVNSLIYPEQRHPQVSPDDLHARYSEFFDYTKKKFSFSAMNHISEPEYQSRNVWSRSPSEVLSAPPRNSPSLGKVNLHLDVHHLPRSASLSPKIQPQSPASERLPSPGQVSRPRSAENSSYPVADSSIVNRIKLQAAAKHSLMRKRHCQDDRILTTSQPLADSSISGKLSPSSLDASESSLEGLGVRTAVRSSDFVGVKVNSFTNWSGGLCLDQVHPALSLTDKIITAGVTGKPTRPFKAYPRDPLLLATSLAAVDPEEYRYSQQDYYEFRDKMLTLTRNGSAQSNPKMRRSGSPASEMELQDGSKDAQYWERRRKNNEAAKRSRDARKAKEDEIAIRAAYLENQNRLLTAEIKHLRFVTEQLRGLARERSSML